ncbi:hypothetical protein BJM39_00330, partial [Salmonella enterica subsp. enterica serovar Javiana]
EVDLSHGDWLVHAESKDDLSSMGPAVFPRYAKLAHPVREGDDPNDPSALMCVEGDLADPELEALVAVLSRHTSTPEDCFFGLWDGFGDIYGTPAVVLISLDDASAPPPVPPAFAHEVAEGPRLHVPGRDYLLFRGPLVEAGRWGAADLVPGWTRRINSPNLMWPADHAWFVATEIDLPWTGIGGSAALVEDLLRADRLNVTPVRR